MSYYNEEDLKDFFNYAKEYVNALKKEEVVEEERSKLEALCRIILTLRYNAMVFESFIQGNSAQDYLLSKDLDSLPLHINDAGLVSQVIIKWRLQRNK